MAGAPELLRTGLEAVTKRRTTLHMLKPEGNEHGNPHTTTGNRSTC